MGRRRESLENKIIDKPPPAHPGPQHLLEDLSQSGLVTRWRERGGENYIGSEVIRPVLAGEEESFLIGLQTRSYNSHPTTGTGLNISGLILIYYELAPHLTTR